MQVADVLALPACAHAEIVRGTAADLTRTVRLAHVIDVPDAQSWVRPGTLLLTTGLSWPREAEALALFGQDLARRGPAAVMLAVPHFFSAFPPEVAGALAESGIPALELPWEVPFVEVVQQTHEFILHAQADHLARSESIHRALTRAALGGQLSDVAGTLSEQLGRVALLLARNGSPLIPHTGLTPAPDPALARLALARPGTAPRPLAGGVLVPVVLRGQREGGVWVAGAASSGQAAAADAGPQAGPGHDLEVRAAEHAATVAALLMLAQQDMEVLEARLGYAFVDTLLEGRFTADSSLHERARRLGFDVLGSYTVALLVLPGALPLLPEGFAQREQATKRLRGALISLGAAPLVSVSLDHIWFLLPQSLSAERVWARLGWQEAGNSETVPGMVYGRERLGVAGVAQSRAEVLALAAYAQPGQLRSYAEVLVPRALSGDRDAQADLMRGLLEPLRGARGGAALIATVQALCDTGFAQAEAAARLKIHGNTLRYRMDRIEALTGRPLADPATRSLWWLALQLGALELGTPQPSQL
ncbi:PucR family transcriptional regulator [Deinococcus aquatilis]|uniref:PucR family transcriptional regulator n=1 Tax=Deinococcus aquatilis TaxID=519440 RepID=UPI000373D33F|nr:PucR family transcriptional regulator [Deinococcus aquatilis]